MRRTSRIAVVAFIVLASLVLVSATAWAAFPGEPDRVLFSRRTLSGVQLRSIRPDGTGGRLVLDRFDEQWAGRWSPDGSRIVFTTKVGPDYDTTEIWTADADGTRRRRVTRNDVLDWEPAWGPGDRLVWSRYTTSDEWRLMVARGDGTRAHAIVRSDASPIYLPVWSPDGGWIAYSQWDGNDMEIWLVRPDGSRRHRLTRTDNANEYGGDFSPDGRVFVFPRFGFDSKLQLRIASVDGAGSRILADLTGSVVPAGGVAFLPDGRRIAFDGAVEGEADIEIFVVPRAGGTPEQLTSNDAQDTLILIAG